MQTAGLYAILNLPERSQLDPRAVLDAMIDGGAGVIQLRSKQAPFEPDLVRALGLRCAAAGVPLILNDDLELATGGVAGVVGVHLGQGDLASLGPTHADRHVRRAQLRACGVSLGVSTHDLSQLRAVLEQLDPDYVGFGPVFSTASKPDHEPVVGLDGLTQACSVSRVPVVAIGGVNVDNAGQIAQCGAAAIAAIGALSGPSVAVVRERTFALARAFANEQ